MVRFNKIKLLLILISGIIHECDCCPKMFHHPYSLDIHKLYHCGSQSFMWCDECGQVFALTESLRQHILEHIAGTCILEIQTN